MRPSLTGRRTLLRRLTMGGLVAAAMFAVVPAALAACPGSEPLKATLQFENAPADVTFDPCPTTPCVPPVAPPKLSIVLQIENCSGGPVFTTDGFSATDFFRRLYFTDPNGGTIINKAEETLHANSPVFFCLSRQNVLQSPAIPVVPVQVLAGPQTPFSIEYLIADARLSYDLSRPGRYSVNARIPLLTFDANDPTAAFGDCDQFGQTTVVNVAGLTGRHEFTVVSNTLQFVIASPPPTSLQLSPASASITAGGGKTYTAEGLDAGNNVLGDVTVGTTFAIDPDGSCTGASCTATAPGPHTVMGQLGSATGTASLMVNVGALDHVTISPTSSSITAGGSQVYTAEGFDASGNSLGNVTGVTTFTITPDGSCAGASCSATAAGSHTVTANDGGKQATASLDVTSTNNLTLGSALVWIGLRDKHDVGITLDLQAIVKKNGKQVGSGQVSGVSSGGEEFADATLTAIPLALTNGPVTMSSRDTLSIEILIRGACTGSGKDSGKAGLWFNGAKIDTGPARDAGSRFDATIGATHRDYFLRTHSMLSTTAGSARTSVDRAAGGKCSAFKSFDTWSIKLP